MQKVQLDSYGGSSVRKPASHRIDGYGIEPVAMPAGCRFGNYAFIYEMMVNEHFKGQWIPASGLYFYPIDDSVRVSHHEIQFVLTVNGKTYVASYHFPFCNVIDRKSVV